MLIVEIIQLINAPIVFIIDKYSFKTLSYMIFGVFESSEIVDPELIPQMLKCAKQFQLRITQFDDDIGRVLVFQLLNVNLLEF